MCDSHQKTPPASRGILGKTQHSDTLDEDFPLCLSQKSAPAALERAEGIKNQFEFLLKCKERGFFFRLVNAKINLRRKREQKFDLL